ncbi:sensor histidine kinase [Spirosoma montaniterrae]|uniref:sensor histidine kinase n=1 Tax=Spirosoma montaniterrae TaxID=1178516 RepID=UPI001E2FC2E5|nr:PAS domain-containing sensor histidine kinase [Spirosoma montaniterrae]
MEVDLDSVAQWTHLDDLPILQEAVGRALQGEDVEMEYRRYDKFGREIFICTIGRIIRNEQGEPMGVFGIDMNITNRKKQEMNLAALNRTLAEKNRELEKRNAELSAFAYAASHDLQEPLRKIQMFNSLILDREANRLSAQGRVHFDRSMAAAERMQTLVKNLIIYARTNTATRHYESVDLNELMGEVEQYLYETIRQKEAIIDYGPLPVVPVVEFMFWQLLQNLLENALRYCRPGVSPVIQLQYGAVDQSTVADLAIAAPGMYHQLTFSDNGTGFEPIYNQKIFGLFQRLHSPIDALTGTGIGLALCQRIMEYHDGYIIADGRPGEGATFTLYWPMRAV